MQIHIFAAFGFLTESRSTKGGEAVTFTCNNSMCAAVSVNGRRANMKDGTARMLSSFLRDGHNHVSIILTDGSVVPCEGIRYAGGYALPAGITEKGFIMQLIERLETSERECERMRDEVQSLKPYAPRDDDLFDIG